MSKYRIIDINTWRVLESFRARSLYEASEITCRKFYTFRPIRSTLSSVEYAVYVGKTIVGQVRLEEEKV